MSSLVAKRRPFITDFNFGDKENRGDPGVESGEAEETSRSIFERKLTTRMME